MTNYRKGSGKSHLLKIIAQQLAARKRSVLLTGATPLSAFNIDGTLLHSFIEGQTVRQLEAIQGLRRKDPASIDYRSKWQKIETLIIDDISQIDASMFDSLEKTARKSKSQKYGFGGIQIIASGDFFQLPPESLDMPAPDYAFNATKWLPTFSTNHVELSKVYSQSEPEFITMLNQARIGKLSPQSDKLLASLARPILTPNIELCPLHVQVKALVSSHLNSLRGNLVDFPAGDKQVTIENVTTSRRLSGIDKRAYDEIIPKFLGLKVPVVPPADQPLLTNSMQVGAQVMSIQVRTIHHL
ncbi:unnamed protein product [Rhizoctonia solani]|uniref:ATP-dependent DNA helicase n=1 Tax=Rhizoctonia solani TaxID=456999 RepID=A0A8H2XU75_9AGAM|nr:unnamed protein product [Rhizoctonia solani]